MKQLNKNNREAIWYILGGLLGIGFLFGSYQANKFPMNNLWNAESIGSIGLFSFFLLFGFYKLFKKRK